MGDSEPGASGGGILQSLRNAAAGLVTLLQTRLELLVTELEEERVRLLQILLWAACALFFFGVGALLLILLIVVLFWETHRVAAIVVLAAIFFALGITLAIIVRRQVHERPRMFAESLGELGKDKDELTRE